MTSPGGGSMTRLVEDGDASEGRRRTNGKRRRRAARRARERRSRFLSERDRTCTGRASSRGDRTSPAPRARAVPRARRCRTGAGRRTRSATLRGTRGSSSARRASSPVWRSSDRAPGSGVSSHDRGWRGEAPARALPSRGTRGPPRPRILRARKDALPRWAGARVAQGPGCAVGRARATFQLDFYDLARDLPRRGFNEHYFLVSSNQTQAPGWVVLVCMSSFGDLKNTLNEISPIDYRTFRL